jgi:hypothetical protein
VTSPTDICNIALAEVGQRIRIGNFQDNSPAAQTAALFYTPKVQALHRAANWAFARAQITLTQWKAVVVGGVISTNPPPQPWLFSYLYPTDCQKLRYLIPTVPVATTNPPLTTNQTTANWYPHTPTAIPFVEATDFDNIGNPIRVILTNIPQAQAIYTRDLSQKPDLWDSLFSSGVTAYLGSYFINALARDKAQMQEQIGIAKNVLDMARMADANEGIKTMDHKPDWMRIRQAQGAPWFMSFASNNGAVGAGWDTCGFPDGSFY